MNRITDISPYDESFPINLLSNAFDMQLEKAEKTSIKIYEDVLKNNLSFDPLPVQGEEKLRLVVDAAEETLQSIHDGKIKLVEEHGKLYAQLREKGRYSSKLPIKEEVYQEGGNAEQVTLAMQLKAIQETLENVTKQLEVIDERVQEVVSGQQTDRLGVYYSGVALYIESTCVTDESMRKNLIAQSMRALSEVIFQMTLLMQSDIKYLHNKEYEKDKKKSYLLLKEKMDRINQCFSVIHQASLLKAGIYCKEGEFLATVVVLEEYARFINGTISKNAKLLSQCDVLDKGVLVGVWNSRANLELDVSKMVACLRSPEKVIYIDAKDGGVNDESI